MARRKAKKMESEKQSDEVELGNEQHTAAPEEISTGRTNVPVMGLVGEVEGVHLPGDEVEDVKVAFEQIVLGPKGA